MFITWHAPLHTQWPAPFSGGYQSIQETIESAAEGAVINIGPGLYQERLILNGPSITLQAYPEVSQCRLQQSQ